MTRGTVHLKVNPQDATAHYETGDSVSIGSVMATALVNTVAMFHGAMLRRVD